MKSIYNAIRLSALFVAALFLFTSAASGQSLRFTDTSYVSLGNDASLKLTNFTLEAWVKIEGYGSTTETGTGGVSGVVPIITKGRAEAEAAAVDVNYFLGYRLSDMRLVADFEDNATSANHPVVSTGAGGVLSYCTWTHVAASYNTVTDQWKLYINGVLNTTLSAGGNFTPQSLSDVSASIGSTLNTGTGIRPGFFNGRIDEVRIWNSVRTDAEILTSFNTELTSGTGLVGRWGLNENSGTTAANSVGGGPSGTLNNSPSWVTGFNQADPTSNASIDLNGAHDYITFGIANGSAGNPSLNVSPNFSLEAWIKREGTGVTASTGTGGVVAVPILAKGRGESDATQNLNMNYFLGIDAAGKLVADFEETTGPNHPVTSVGTIPTGTWTHVAATYNNTTRTWKLFINGVLDITEAEPAGNPPVNNSIQHASIGTAMNSTGVTEGFFSGKIDEVRIWNTTRTDAEISTNFNNQLTSGTGLVARYGFNENCGLSAVNSIAGGSTGSIRSNEIAAHPTNGGPAWVSSGFNNLAPAQPTNPSPAHNGTSASLNPDLCTTVSDPNGGTLRVRYFGRKKQTSANKFTVIWLPDTQYYVEEPPAHGGTPAMFNAQTAWIVNNRATRNIVYVGQLGDCVEHGDAQPIEWTRAATAMYPLENAGTTGLPEGIPYGVCAGNHDQTPAGDPLGTTTGYNNTFGIAHFSGKSYYGGHNGTNNDNHYQLFSANGTDYMVISLEYDQTAGFSAPGGALDWAESLVVANPNKKIMLMTHYTIDGSAAFGTQGQAMYNRLRVYPNVFLMVGGHITGNTGEARRTDSYGSNTIHTILSDYQGRTNGGNGLLRIFEFRPATNDIFVQTYSPVTNTFETDASSEFTLPFTMAPYSLIGEVNNVASGSSPCVPWTGLDQLTDYEWYVEVFDGENTTTGPVWAFTTPSGAALPVSYLSFTGTPETRRVRLNWKTANEVNNDHFNIERSADGSNYTKIGEVPGNGTSSVSHDYLFYDDLPVRGKSFYRLQQVDTDNRFKYSNIVAVKYGDKTKYEIFPNPVTGSEINVFFNESVKGDVDIRIHDMSGKELFVKHLKDPAGNIKLHTSLSAGMYIVKISSAELNTSDKIIVTGKH